MNVDAAASFSASLSVTAAANVTARANSGFSFRMQSSFAANITASGSVRFHDRLFLSGALEAGRFYLGRPVYNLDVDWGNTPKKSFADELNSKLLGFGLPRYEQRQADTIPGLQLSLLLDSDQST